MSFCNKDIYIMRNFCNIEIREFLNFFISHFVRNKKTLFVEIFVIVLFCEPGKVMTVFPISGSIIVTHDSAFWIYHCYS